MQIRCTFMQTHVTSPTTRFKHLKTLSHYFYILLKQRLIKFSLPEKRYILFDSRERLVSRL